MLYFVERSSYPFCPTDLYNKPDWPEDKNEFQSLGYILASLSKFASDILTSTPPFLLRIDLPIIKLCS
nr:MAG TPA: hypothetical protein [Caudoviricetes sp.]